MDKNPTVQRAEQDAPIAVYVHIPKTAGSTLQSVLSQNYAPDRSIRLDGPLLEKSCREFSEKCAGVDPKLVYGHHPFGAHILLHRPWLYFTLLRDPVERLASEYYYAFQYDKHRFVEEIRSGQLTLEKFMMLDHWFTGNLLTNYVSGLRNIKDHEKLETAKLNLRERFASFGLMEHFGDSVLLMASDLGWDRLLYVKRNVTREHEGIGRELRARVEKKLEVDMEFYEYACALFRERMDRQPDSFGDARREYTSKLCELGQAHADLIYSEFNFKRGNDLKIDEIYESMPDTNRYLQETRRARSRPRCLRGTVERASLRSVSGWALDNDDDRRTVKVRFEVDDCGPIRIPADRMRQDLVHQGSSSIDHGFAFDFDPVLDETLPHTLRFFHAETGWPLNRGNWTYDPRKGWKCAGGGWYAERDG